MQQSHMSRKSGIGVGGTGGHRHIVLVSGQLTTQKVKVKCSIAYDECMCTAHLPPVGSEPVAR